MKLQDVLIIDMDHVVSSEKNARPPKDFDAITMEGIVVSSQLELEEGLKAQIWYGQFRSPVRITFNSLSPAQPPVCTLAYTTMPEAFFFKCPLIGERKNARSQIQSFFSTHHSATDIEILPHRNMNALCLTISAEWMNRGLKSGDERTSELVNQLIEQEKSSLLVNDCTAKENLLLGDILDHYLSNRQGDLFIHSRILLLIAEFFQKLVSSPGSRATDYHDKISRIKQAEDILVDSLRNNLPPVKEIAQAVFMSESTLKRYFKVFYGKNIYEFYLQKKMELAKRMMIEENLNVSQVAREIGYENPNNFIATFKKHFGYLPGEIRRGA